jgi:GR25 family glycosyltransferase involved in LPS biosynthesis
VIDDYITAQHLRAWEMFIESGMDYLLILEDDVYLNDQSVYLFNHRIVKTIFLIETQHINSGLFVDCAGGFSLDELQTDNLEIKHEEMLRWYYKPVTNTACAYIINRIIAKKFFFIMIRNPWLRLIPVDWLMNKLFLLMGEDAKRCICFHADPPVFIHGSAAGIYSARP